MISDVPPSSASTLYIHSVCRPVFTGTLQEGWVFQHFLGDTWSIIHAVSWGVRCCLPVQDFFSLLTFPDESLLNPSLESWCLTSLASVLHALCLARRHSFLPMGRELFILQTSLCLLTMANTVTSSENLGHNIKGLFLSLLLLHNLPTYSHWPRLLVDSLMLSHEASKVEQDCLIQAVSKERAGSGKSLPSQIFFQEAILSVSTCRSHELWFPFKMHRGESLFWKVLWAE